MAQDTISKMTLYGDENVYQKKIHKEFVKVNKLYRTGIRHGLYYVYDIVDTSNKLSSEKDTLYFVNKHIYYVVSPSVYIILKTKRATFSKQIVRLYKTFNHP